MLIVIRQKIPVYEEKLMRIFLSTSECPYLSEKIYKNPILKKYLAHLARGRASAAIGDSG